MDYGRMVRKGPESTRSIEKYHADRVRVYECNRVGAWVGLGRFGRDTSESIPTMLL